MAQAYKPIHYQKYSANDREAAQGNIITEKAVSLTVNGKVWLTFMCTPINLEALALGFLYNESIIDSMEDVADIRMDLYFRQITKMVTTHIHVV